MSTDDLNEIKGFFKIFKWGAGIFTLPALAAFLMILNASFSLKALESSVQDIKAKTEMISTIQQDTEVLKIRFSKMEPRVEVLWNLSEEKFPQKYPNK